MKSLIIALVIVLAVGLVLSVSVPDEASFHHYLAKADRSDGGSLLDEAGDALTRAQARLTTDYQDHTFWATVEVTRGGDHQRWLGVMGMWLEMSSSSDR